MTTKTTSPEFQPIPDVDLPSQIGKRVHVQGWPPSCSFIYKGPSKEKPGHHILQTRTKTYTVSFQLLYTHRNKP